MQLTLMNTTRAIDGAFSYDYKFTTKSAMNDLLEENKEQHMKS
jgi:hypothetical protein